MWTSEAREPHEALVTTPSWDLVRILLVTQRAGTLEAAAHFLEIDVSTLRRKLRALETQVGMPLLRRADGRALVAPELQSLLDSAERMDLAFQDFLQGCASSGRGGTLRVSTLDILADILVDGLPVFRASHPGIQVALTTEPHFVDLERDRIDVAIRLARPLRGREGLRRLTTLRFAVYAAASYVEAWGRRPDGVHDLLSLYTHYSRLDHDFALADERWHLEPSLAGTVVARVDNYPNLLRMCEQGLGLAMLPCALGDASARVRRFAGARRTIDVDVWALIRHDVAKLPRTQAFLKFATRIFTAHESQASDGPRARAGGSRARPLGPTTDWL